MDEKPKRRWFRFTLRTWLLAVTALCFWLGWWSQSALRQKRIVAQLTSKKVGVMYDVACEEQLPGRYFGVRSKPPGWLENQLGIDYFHDVVLVQKDGNSTATKEEFVTALSCFPKLKILCFLDLNLDNDDYRSISRCSQLEVLNVSAEQGTAGFSSSRAWIR